MTSTPGSKTSWSGPLPMRTRATFPPRLLRRLRSPFGSAHSLSPRWAVASVALTLREVRERSLRTARFALLGEPSLPSIGRKVLNPRLDSVAQVRCKAARHEPKHSPQDHEWHRVFDRNHEDGAPTLPSCCGANLSAQTTPSRSHERDHPISPQGLTTASLPGPHESGEASIAA